jgi:hypothetical protein
MDDLFRALFENYIAREAQKGTKFASRYLHRQRLKQAIVVSGRSSEKDVENFNHEVSAFMNGPYGKAWKGGMKEQPPRILLQHQLAIGTSSSEAIFKKEIPYKRACEGHRVHNGYTVL